MFFIRCTLLFANSFSYIPNKADMRFVVVLSFITVCSTNLDRVSQIIPEPVDPTNLTQYLHALQLLTQQRKVEPLSIQIILDLHLPLTKICYQTFRFQSFNLLQKLFYLDPKNLELLVPVVKKKTHRHNNIEAVDGQQKILEIKESNNHPRHKIYMIQQLAY